MASADGCVDYWDCPCTEFRLEGFYELDVFLGQALKDVIPSYTLCVDLADKHAEEDKGDEEKVGERICFGGRGFARGGWGRTCGAVVADGDVTILIGCCSVAGCVQRDGLSLDVDILVGHGSAGLLILFYVEGGSEAARAE